MSEKPKIVSDLTRLLETLLMQAQAGAITDLLAIGRGPGQGNGFYTHNFVIPRADDMTAMVGEMRLMELTLAGNIMNQRAVQGSAKAPPGIIRGMQG